MENVKDADNILNSIINECMPKRYYGHEARKNAKMIAKRYNDALKQANEKVEPSSSHIGDISGSYYLLNEGDIIKCTDEYQDSGFKWRVTGQGGKVYKSSQHAMHRRFV